MSVFPVFLKLHDKQVLVVGAGPMALEKIPALIAAGARVKVVSPEIHPDIRALGDLELIERPFVPSDLDGVWYAVAAAPSEVNRAVSEAAAERQVFVNAVDDLRYADVYLGSVLRRGGMTFAISSDGASPALTALVRRGLERLIPDELDEWIRIGKELRPQWKRDGIAFSARRPLLLKAINRWQADLTRQARRSPKSAAKPSGGHLPEVSS